MKIESTDSKADQLTELVRMLSEKIESTKPLQTQILKGPQYTQVLQNQKPNPDLQGDVSCAIIQITALINATESCFA